MATSPRDFTIPTLSDVGKPVCSTYPLAAAGELDLSRSITARYPLERAAEALDDLHDRRGDPVRLALLPARD